MSISLFWAANPAADNVTFYTLSRAAGLGAPFSAALPIFTGDVLAYVDSTAVPSVGYSYFVQAGNAIGLSLPSAGLSITAPGGTIVAAEMLAANALVNVYTSGGITFAQNANATDGSKPATGFAPAGGSTGAPVIVFSPGQVMTGLSGLTPGPYFLDTSAGAMTATSPSTTGNLVQQIGVAASATEIMFYPYPGTVA